MLTNTVVQTYIIYALLKEYVIKILNFINGQLIIMTCIIKSLLFLTNKINDKYLIVIYLLVIEFSLTVIKFHIKLLFDLQEQNGKHIISFFNWIQNMLQKEQKGRENQTAQSSKPKQKAKKQSKSYDDDDSRQLYMKIMDKIQCNHNFSYIIEKLTNNNIKYTQEAPLDYELHTQILRSTYNFQAVLLRLNYCKFNTQVSLYNIPGHFQFQGTLLGSGSYGDVYAYKKSSSQIMAIKVIKQNKFYLHKILKQYFMNLIMSALECGPKICKYFGFDILLFQQSALFCMELCSLVNEFSERDKEYLLQKLKQIHSLNIIHGDIKPENIVYSNFFKKPVFCDFGLTKSISEKIGQKSPTCFFGSYSFASPQMFQLLTKKLYGDVDLYYNDLFALQRTFQQICYIDKKQNLKGMLNKSKVFDYCLANYLVFMKQYQLISQIEHQKQLLNFLLLMEPSQQLYTFLSRNFGFKQNCYIQVRELTLARQIYTHRGISIKKWQQLHSKYETNFKNRFVNIEKTSRSQNSQKIETLEKLLEEPALKFDQLCEHTVEYLALWQDDAWNNAQIMISKIFPKYKKSCNQLAKNNIMTIPKSIEIESQLIQILVFLLQKYLKQHNIWLLSKLHDFASHFLHPETCLQIQFFNLQMMIKAKIFDEQTIINQTVNFMIAGIIPIDFFFIQNIFIQRLSNIKSLLIQSFLQQQLQNYLTILKSVCFDRKIIQIQTLFNRTTKIQNHRFRKLFQIVYLCLKMKILRKDGIVDAFHLLQSIQSSLDQINFSCVKSIKKFVKYGFIDIYADLKNQRGYMLAIQQIQGPKSFKNLWSSQNIIILICKHSIMFNWASFCQEMSKYLHDKNFSCFVKLRHYFQFQRSIRMFFHEFYEILNQISVQCLQQLRLLSEQQMLQNTTQYIMKILQLICLNHQAHIFCDNKQIIENRLIQLNSLFSYWSHLAKQDQMGKFITLNIIFLYQQQKFDDLLNYYMRHKEIKIGPKQKVHCLYYVSLCFNPQDIEQSNCLQVYTMLKQKDDFFLISSSSYFINMLQHLFYNKQMLEEYIQLVEIMLKQIYLFSYIAKATLKYFIKYCIYHFPTYAMALLDRFLKKSYYLQNQIEYHNCSALLIEAMYELNYRQKQRLSLLQKVAITLDSLQAKIRLMIRPKYDQLMLSCVEQRKKIWILHKLQTVKQKCTKKKSLIKQINKKTLNKKPQVKQT